MPARFKSVRLIVLSAVLILCVGVALLGRFEGRIVRYFIPMNGWVQFKIPPDARAIRASVKESAGGLEVCNNDEVDWSDITVKGTGIYNAPYLARPKPLRAGTCEHVAYSDFAEPSWKRMKMPPNASLVKVELLVKYEAGGYTSLPLEQK